MGSRLRRAAGASVALGVSVLVSSTVALAQDPVPTPSATPVPTVTVAPTPAATAFATPTATVALTPEPTVTAAPTSAPTAAATASATPKPPTAVEQRPQGPARQAATPTPTPTATPDPGDAGATITACHALDDGTYETVTITLYPGVLDEHFDHDNDIIPAPATGCGPGAQPDESVGVCHATGDPEQPYEFAGFFPPSNLEGHENHAGDLIPAPNGTCPGLDEYFVPTPAPTEEPTAEPTATAFPTQTPTAEPTPTATADVIDEGDGGGGGSSPGGGTAGSTTQGTGSYASAAYLPFTGFELWLIAAAGLGLLMMGGGLRLLAAQPAVGVTR